MPIVCSLCGESGLTHAVLDDCSPEMYWPRLTVRPGRDVFGLLEFGRASVESFLSAIDRFFGDDRASELTAVIVSMQT